MNHDSLLLENAKIRRWGEMITWKGKVLVGDWQAVSHTKKSLYQEAPLKGKQAHSTDMYSIFIHFALRYLACPPRCLSHTQPLPTERQAKASKISTNFSEAQKPNPRSPLLIQGLPERRKSLGGILISSRQPWK